MFKVRSICIIMIMLANVKPALLYFPVCDITLCAISEQLPSKYDILTQCWIDGGSPSGTLARHWLTSVVYWVTAVM